MNLLRRMRAMMGRNPSAGGSRTREEWNREYSGGRWDLLKQADEMARYWIAAGYCAQKFERPSVLDVGCGVGLMEERLRPLPYSFYLGIDFSLEALEEMLRRPGPERRVACADMFRFWVRRKFDVVLFMEALEPGMPAAEILKLYRDLLNPGGRIIVSMFDGRNRAASAPAWKSIGEEFQIEDVFEIENLPTRKSWKVGLLAP